MGKPTSIALIMAIIMVLVGGYLVGRSEAKIHFAQRPVPIYVIGLRCSYIGALAVEAGREDGSATHADPAVHIEPRARSL